MSTLATEAVPADYVPKFLRVEDLARLLDVRPAWIYKRRDEGVIEPLVTYDGLEFGRETLVRLSAYKTLQECLGEKSPVPARLVREAAKDLDACAQGTWILPSSAQSAIERGLGRIVRAVREDLQKRLAAA